MVQDNTPLKRSAEDNKENVTPQKKKTPKKMKTPKKTQNNEEEIENPIKQKYVFQLFMLLNTFKFISPLQGAEIKFP